MNQVFSNMLLSSSDASAAAAAAATTSASNVELNEHSVSASAPGKVILFGEHSVVYGKPAIAAALSDLRISVLLTPIDSVKDSDDTSDQIQVIMNDLGFMVQVSKSYLCATLRQQQLPMPPAPDTVSHIEGFIQESRETGELVVFRLPSFSGIESDLTLLPVIPVLFLLDQLAPTSFWDNMATASDVPKTPQGGLKMWVRSKDLPVGAGLGSSAAFSVALAATLFQWRKNTMASSSMVQESDKDNMINQGGDTELTPPAQPNIHEVDEINKYAFASEILLHGTPSGLDDAVSTHGGALWYSKELQSTEGADGKNDSSSSSSTADPRKATNLKGCASQMLALTPFPTLDLLLVHTHVPRSTKALVAGVRNLYNRHRTVIQPILDAMGEIVVKVRGILTATSEDVNEQGNKWLDCGTPSESPSFAFLDLVRLNQDCLRALGVSHPKLDQIDQLIRNKYSQVAAAKLTGAGGGGCALVLLRPELPKSGVDIGVAPIQSQEQQQKDTTLQEIESDLEPLGYTIIRSKVGGPGVIWENPRSFSIAPIKDKRTDPRVGGLLVQEDSSTTWPIPLAALLGGAVSLLVIKNGMKAFGKRN